MLDVAAYLIRPDDHNALELAVLGLLHGQGGEQVRDVAAMLSATYA